MKEQRRKSASIGFVKLSAWSRTRKWCDTLTVDNGSEFADADGIERSARRKDAKRTTVYYCHAYSSCERGTNENINRMIRRQFPKGTDFDKVTAAEVKRVETWLNNYPREILGFMSSAQAFELAFDRAA